MTDPTKKVVMQVLKAFEEFGDDHPMMQARPRVVPGARLYFKGVDLVSFLYAMLLLAEPEYAEFGKNQRYLVEDLFDDVTLAKLEAAFYADPERARPMDRYFKIYGDEAEEARFWHNMEGFARAFPNPFERVKILLYVLLMGGDPFYLGTVD